MTPNVLEAGTKHKHREPSTDRGTCCLFCAVPTMVHTSLEVSAPCPLLRSGKLRLFTTHCSAISANATIPPLENAQSLILDRPNIYSLVRMVDLPIDVCITPRVPPQPSPPIQDHLLTLDEVNSKNKTEY